MKNQLRQLLALSVVAGSAFAAPLSLDSLRLEKKLAGMALLQKGSRLSVQPVTKWEWEHILKLAAG